MAHTKLIVAFDFKVLGDEQWALLGRLLKIQGIIIKIGHRQTYARGNLQGFSAGRSISRKCGASSKGCFLDAKLVDVESTVEDALDNILTEWYLSMFTFMAGSMSDGALDAVRRKLMGYEVLPLGVAVPTDIDEGQCMSLFGDTPINKVVQCAQRLRDHDLKGLVCSGHELEPVRKKVSDMTLVATAIQPSWATWAKNDTQKRTMDHIAAARAGADFVIMGTALLKAPNTIEAAQRAAAELSWA